VSTAAVQRTLIVVLIALLAAIGIVVASHAGSSASKQTTASHNGPFLGPTLPAGLRAGNFTLRDQRGRAVSLGQLRGRVVILTFIHSHCKDACPLMVEDIKGALNLMGGRAAGIAAVGISVQPAEDTAASRSAFMRRHGMNQRMAFLNGPLRALRAVWRAYAIQPVQGPIDHSTFVLLIDRRGYERIGWPADQLTPEGLAHDLGVLQRRA
jgi:protein SCO1/2